jgi:hypothetical protein
MFIGQSFHCQKAGKSVKLERFPDYPRKEHFGSNQRGTKWLLIDLL